MSSNTPVSTRRRRGLLGSALTSLPGVARIGAETVVHTTAWSATQYAKGVVRVARAVVDPEAAAALSDDLATITDSVLDITRALTRGGGPVVGGLGKIAVPALESVRSALEASGTQSGETEEERLRRTGSELLRRSRDVWSDEARHPAYESILRELAPDEARILVLLLRNGPQPSVDVRSAGVRGRMQPEVIARGLNMFASWASVRYPESIPAYLNNLTRLGLIWQSPEPLKDLLRYQVLEAQPDVLEAKHAGRRAVTVRRSVHLTPFGSDFARVCFATAEEADTAHFPDHEPPPDAATSEAVED
ncbi:MAG: Abi-alpha family protein [Nocardioides sp.]|uniref:Abi-alpha family protein n=1 Tax=Nocardioides sp. TaxID=35761 RepID=UPI0039E6D678